MGDLAADMAGENVAMAGGTGGQAVRVGSAAIAIATTLQAGAALAQLSQRTRATTHRIVHHFDFDERDDGNLEDVPKYWTPFRPQRFPHYTSAAFDFAVGRDAPPAFFLNSEGRNVAYHYGGPETRVRTNSDYRIAGYIRPYRLEHARACLSAHFLDKDGRPIPDTLTRSRFIGGPDNRDGWSFVELFLPAAPPDAYSIGLIAWVLQEPMWQTEPRPAWHISRVDVFGGAWFDDLTVYRLPRAEIRSAAPGNIFAPDQPQILEVILADHDDTTLEGKLTITAADGRIAQTVPVPVNTTHAAAPRPVSLEALPPGLYHARLDVSAAGRIILTRTLVFARVAPLTRETKTLARSFGVVLDPDRRVDMPTELTLLTAQGVHSAKIPVWTGRLDAPPNAAKRRESDHFYQELIKRGFALTGVLAGPPAAMVRSYIPSDRRLVEVLNDDPSIWEQHLAAVVAPYASVFRWWQVGPEGASFLPPWDKLFRSAIVNLRSAMEPYLTVPLVSAPWNASRELTGPKLDVEQLSLDVGPQLPPDALPALLDRAKAAGYGRSSLFIEPLPADAYRREARLADWAARLILARHAGARTVFAPQTWDVRTTPHGSNVEPDETFIILRTLADKLADSDPGPELSMPGGARALAFVHGEDAVLALWDPKAGSGFRRHALQLGRAATATDLWGHVTTLQRDDSGRQIVALSPSPVFVEPVERWLVDLRNAISLTPQRIESGLESVRFTVELAYPRGRPVSGRLMLDPPQGWEVSPRVATFRAMPQRAERMHFAARLPHNAPAGTKRLMARITVADDDRYIEVPLSVEVGLSDVEVSGFAVVEGSMLILRQVITNRADQLLSFRATANVPGRERQYRPVANLRPGETQAVEYRFPHAADLVARTVQLSLRQLPDGPRVHTLALTIP